jgi:hypothetical protein
VAVSAFFPTEHFLNLYRGRDVISLEVELFDDLTPTKFVMLYDAGNYSRQPRSQFRRVRVLRTMDPGTVIVGLGIKLPSTCSFNHLHTQNIQSIVLAFPA